MNGERQPSLQSNMHQAKLAVLIIVIKVQALAFFRHQLQMLRHPVSLQVKGLTRFDARKHTDQSCFDPILLPDSHRQFFFRSLGRLQVLIWSSQLAGSVLGVFDNPLRQTFSVSSKIFEQDVLAVQENLQPANMGNRTQGAAEQHPIKTPESSSYAANVPLQKTLHDSPPALLCWSKHIMPEGSHGAFLILVAA